MNKKLLLFAAVLASCASPKQDESTETMKIDYPQTRQDSTIVDDYFGTKVQDPYRWLEDDRSPETEEWVTAQNKVTFGYLEQIPYRNAIKDRLTELWNYEKYSAPFKRGEYTYFYKNVNYM